MSKRKHGSLPSNTEKNPKEQMQDLTLRNGKVLKEGKSELNKEDSEEVEVHLNLFPKEVKPYNPPVPFPQRLKQQQLDKQGSKILEVFKKLHINIPLVDSLAQMPSYAKFLKRILANKRKLEEFETIKLNEECYAIFQNKLPPKLKNSGSFTIPCTIGSSYFEKVYVI